MKNITKWLLFVILISAVELSGAVTYDDFEDGSLHGEGKWNSSSADVRIKSGAEGNYAMQLSKTNNIVTNQSINYGSQTAIKLMLYANVSVFPTAGLAQIGVISGAIGDDCALVDPSYPVANEWGYYNGGWTGTGVSSIDENPINLTWSELTLVVDNANNKLIVRIADSTSDLINVSFKGTCPDATKFFIIQVSNNSYYDNIRIWNFSEWGWNGPSIFTQNKSFTITAVGGEKLGQITSFSANINGTVYSTTNGTINTENKTVLTTWNISVSAYGFENRSFYNLNMSNPFAANLTQISYNNANVSIEYEYARRGHNVTINCSFNNTPNLPYNLTYWYNNKQNGTTHNITSSLYQITNEDVFRNLSFWCTIDTHFNKTTSPNTTLNNPDNNLVLRVINADQNLMPSVNILLVEPNITQTNNPITILASTFLNITSYARNITVTITDPSGYFQSYTTTKIFNASISEYNFTTDTNRLIINFWQSNVAYNTSGWITDLNKSINFTNSTINEIQMNLTKGPVYVKFGNIVGSNHTQFYEFNNDWRTHVDENVEIFPTADWFSYIQVLDYGGAPIKDVIIRAKIANPTDYPNWTTSGFIGQRLTSDSGKTFFWGTSERDLIFYLGKTGYQPINLIMTYGEDTYTQNDPYVVTMQENESYLINNDDWIRLDTTFWNRSKDIQGSILAMNADLIEMTTSYRTSIGLTKYDLTATTCDEWNRCTFTLYSGTDFPITGTSNFSVQFYLNSVLTENITMVYQTWNESKIFENIANENNKKQFNPILLIALIIISASISFIFKEDNLGVIAFDVGTAILAIISSSFAVLFFITALKYIAITIKRVTSE